MTRFLGACFLALIFSACSVVAVEPEQSGTEPAVKLIDREEALQLAQSTAKAHGYDLNTYMLSSFGNELTEDRQEWLFVYVCKPLPPPGCDFMVTVNRVTGESRLIAGQ